MVEAPPEPPFTTNGAPLRIVLIHPEIPPNTGSIGRLCVGTGCELHLVRPLGFSIDEKAVRRAGLDYWKDVALFVHADLDAFLHHAAGTGGRLVCLSARASMPYTALRYQRGDYLLFGRESSGLPPGLLADPPGPVLRIPHLSSIRSINLANAVTLVLFEGLRQLYPLEFPGPT